jgi:hypothetical protein
VALESVRNKISHRTQTRLTLTALGIAYAQTLKPGWNPARLSLVDWEAQLAEMTQERVPAALQIARDAEDGARWRAAEARRKAADRAAERAAREKPEPKRPSAGRNRSEEELEARREWAASKGFSAKDQSVSDDDEPEPIVAPAERCIPPSKPVEPINHYDRRMRGDFEDFQTPLPPSAPPTPKTPQEEYIAALRISAEAAGFQRQSYMPKDCRPAEPNPNRERILKLFHETPYAGDLLPNGNILYDCREMSLEQWERERFRTS